MSNNLLYGIWVRGQGWLKNDRNLSLSFDSKDVADEVAKRIGGKVFFIDKSLDEIESVLLEIERKKLWNRISLRNFLLWLNSKRKTQNLPEKVND